MPRVRGDDGLPFIPYVADKELPNLNRQDYVIINSVSNVSKATDVLHRYERIHCLLDNDEAGRKAYRELERELSGRIRDFSHNYS